MERIQVNKSVGDARRAIRRGMESEKNAKLSSKITMSNVMLILMVAVAAVVSMSGIKFTWENLGKITALSILLYGITSMVYRNRYDRGKRRGRLDPDFECAITTYRQKRKDVDKHSLLGRVPQFCREYKINELREYRADLLVDIDMTYEEYEECYMHLTKKEVMALPLTLDARHVILKCNLSKPLRLTPGIILNENGEAERHKLLGQSGRDREHKDKLRQMLTRAALILFGSFVGFEIVADFSLPNVLRWLVRMLPIAVAIVTGDDDGYCNITVTEVAFKRGQTAVIGMLFEWAGVKVEAFEDKSEAISETNEERVMESEIAENQA